ncbi:MAG: hotdog fold thioesterase [Crocinitomicaceae bacterium]|nr:hotdog fold thioesterase [Crocinitomicaceae bacterium]MBK8925162.1 hotdog fold thioesterase [Crocinitomicaceae bacterium]
MESKLSPREIIEKMMSQDNMSRWLGIEILSYNPGAVSLRMQVRDEMCNGFGVTHGGITYSLADSALAFSANSYGIQSMSIETSISHMKSVHTGDTLIVNTKQLVLTRKTGVFEMEVFNQNNVMVAHFKGTVYRSDKVWE